MNNLEIKISEISQRMVEIEKEVNAISHLICDTVFTALLFVLFLGVLSFAVRFAFLREPVSTSGKIAKYSTNVISYASLLGIFSFIFLMAINADDKKLLEYEYDLLAVELEKLETKLAKMELKEIENLSKNNVLSVDMIDVVLKIPAFDELCPELRGTDRCYFLEFASNGHITQTFVPLDNKSLQNIENGLMLDYFEVTEEEMNEFINVHNLKEIDVIRNPIYIENLVIGKKVK